jgi:hypothetical protein
MGTVPILSSPLSNINSGISLPSLNTTRAKIAAEVGVDETTVQNAAEFTHAVD